MSTHVRYFRLRNECVEIEHVDILLSRMLLSLVNRMLEHCNPTGHGEILGDGPDKSMEIGECY
jgi:hypothetical protein